MSAQDRNQPIPRLGTWVVGSSHKPGKASKRRAAEYNELRSEVMQSMAKARDERDFDNRLKLVGLRDELTRQAAAEGLGLDDTGRFVPARA